MKKYLSLILALTLAASAGCSKSDSSSEGSSSKTSEAATEASSEASSSGEEETAEPTTEEKTEPATESSGDGGDLSEDFAYKNDSDEIELLSYRVGNIGSDEYVEVNYRYKSDDEVSLSLNAFQNGIALDELPLDEVVSAGEDEAGSGDKFAGRSVYRLRDRSGVYFVSRKLFSEDDRNVAEAKIDLGEGSGYEIPEDKGETSVKIVDSYMDDEEENRLMIEYEFHNGFDDIVSFSSSVYDAVTQNGEECGSAFYKASPNGEVYDAYTKMLPGATAKILCGYYIDDKSDVTVKVSEAFSYEDKVYLEETLPVK